MEENQPRKSSKTMSKKKNELITKSETQLSESQIFDYVSNIIETRKSNAGAYANREVTLMYWEVGHYINSVVLNDGRAGYGKKILPELAVKLIVKYGKSFSERNLYRMMLFATRFSDEKILPLLAAKLNWSHFIELLTLKSDEARLYYAQDVVARNYGAKELRRQISRKAFERREIANTGLSLESAIPFNTFKDPYLLDVLGLKDNYLEGDLEKAILAELEAFILEFGNGLSFVARQKRMIIDGEDIVLDLLFYHRIIKRLIAVELKLGRFKAAYKGQMELYLKWLDKYERQPGEEAPIGLILCATASREKIEMLELDKSGIVVAEYWTDMPPRADFERKIREILAEAKERLERRKLLIDSDIKRDIEYFYEPKGDDDE